MQFQLPETKDENILINCRMRSTFLAKGLKYKLFIVLFVTCICVCFHNLIQEIICLSLINNAILFLLVSCQFVNINFPCDQIQNAEKLRKIENEMGKKSLSTFWLKFEMEKESLVPSYLFFNQKEIILLHNFKKKKRVLRTHYVGCHPNCVCITKNIYATPLNIIDKKEENTKKKTMEGLYRPLLSIRE